MGQQLGMALSGFGDIALYYNKADFAAAGIRAPPSDVDQLAADAVKLTVPAAKRWGFYVPMGDAEWISYDWEPVLWGDGGHIAQFNRDQGHLRQPRRRQGPQHLGQPDQGQGGAGRQLCRRTAATTVAMRSSPTPWRW